MIMVAIRGQECCDDRASNDWNRGGFRAVFAEKAKAICHLRRQASVVLEGEHENECSALAELQMQILLRIYSAFGGMADMAGPSTGFAPVANDRTGDIVSA